MSDLSWKLVIAGQATIVETQKRNGSWVRTSVSAVEGQGVAYFVTDSSSGKVKRIRNFRTVRVAASTYRGVPTGEFYAATARRLEGAEGDEALREIRRAHPVVFGVIIRVRYWVHRIDGACFELSRLRPLDAPER
ncbi:MULTISPECIES: hypothetical protein [unclassified Cryobacterium]|uniref:hypothetical protein n=1 Tax=unclassified Cryobacterium TaxID=2649013 RepID=UPI002AB40540|nr:MULTISPECIES: hypothetical protein [unclassified Cryobacterium]MDY7543057.1 hypothetical protein [Cryobacterium sp. 5B3]MEB0000257.1 hypothetical protein [Cryobacterium sp. RTS3]MEB0267150.1 hypothetical protein [Cryobacterium sp. 10I5]MEB0274492.1 hypothetical protein [Cryobacterium sp. 5B3]